MNIVMIFIVDFELLLAPFCNLEVAAPSYL